MTLDLILKVLLTAILGYVALNTFFKFHFSIDRIIFLLMVMVTLISIFFLDTLLYLEIAITVASAIVVAGILKIITIKKKRHGYLLFNTFKKQYDDVSKDITELADEFNIARKNINYNRRRPWLVCIKDVELKKADKLIKKLDNIYTHKPKSLTMYNYWTVIVFLTLMASIWRFL